MVRIAVSERTDHPGQLVATSIDVLSSGPTLTELVEEVVAPRALEQSAALRTS
jgi:hypothetical protein